jgi:integrase/recombinase XerD
MESESIIRYLEKMKLRMKLLNYSPQSIESYLPPLKRFLIHIDDHPKNINKGQIELFLVEMGEISKPYQKQCHCAVLLFYREIIHQPNKMDGLKIPHWERKLQVPIDPKVILDAIESATDKRHKAILALLFSSGLRREEAATLRLSDIDSKNMFIVLREGKGGKDRRITLSKDCLEILRDYLRSLHYKPQVYLFENPNGRYISPDTLLKVCHKYIDARTHDIRRAYATDMFRNNVPLPKIQKLLGHKDMRTTMIYINIDEDMLRGIYNPLDKLKRQDAPIYELKRAS